MSGSSPAKVMRAERGDPCLFGSLQQDVSHCLTGQPLYSYTPHLINGHEEWTNRPTSHVYPTVQHPFCLADYIGKSVSVPLSAHRKHSVRDGVIVQIESD